MTTLLERNNAFIANAKANGRKVLSLDCPICEKSIETIAAPKSEEWDSLSQCPHCEAMYLKYVTHKKASGFIPRTKQHA